MKKLALVGFMLFYPVWPSVADPLQWNLPGGIGTIQLPTSGNAILPTVGQDFVLRKTIVGLSTPVLTIAKEINGYVGAVGEFHNDAPNFQPYLALGADVKKYIPGLNQIQSLQIQGFGRWDTSEGGAQVAKHLGAGLALSYSL